MFFFLTILGLKNSVLYHFHSWWTGTRHWFHYKNFESNITYKTLTNSVLGARPTVHETAESVAENFVVKTREENGQTVGQLRDLIVIMDSSGSIGQTNFNKAKTQLARLLGLLCPDPDPFSQRQQVALIEFGSTVREVFDFNDNRNTQQVQDSIRRMTYMGGSTCSATAFNFANTNMFSTVKGNQQFIILK